MLSNVQKRYEKSNGLVGSDIIQDLLGLVTGGASQQTPTAFCVCFPGTLCATPLIIQWLKMKKQINITPLKT
jgi:hypothetical protein